MFKSGRVYFVGAESQTLITLCTWIFSNCILNKMFDVKLGTVFDNEAQDGSVLKVFLGKLNQADLVRLI